MGAILKIVSVIIGALIGAGFASGQEVYVFFYLYGIKGLLGIIVCSIFVSIVSYKVLKIIDKNDINTYNEFVEFLAQKIKINKYLRASSVINAIVNIFLLITFYIMIAGFGAYFSQEFGINKYIGSTILAALCFITFRSNANGVIKINSCLIPILIIFIVVIGSININSIDINQIIENNLKVTDGNWFLSSLLYVSYNSILLIPVLMTLKGCIKTKKSIAIASILSGIIICILAVMIYMFLVRVDINIQNLEMPVVYVIGKFFSGFKIIYALIILASIYTTAISIGVSFLRNITKNNKVYTHIAIFMCITSVLISGFGFSNLINLIYPVFGYLGLLQICVLLIK